MIPLSRVLARLHDSNGTAAEPEASLASHAEGKTATYNGTDVCSPWNPTGDIFDLLPDLAHTPISELATALFSMRQLLRTSDESINRTQLMRFERQYSNALWRRASAEKVDKVAIGDKEFRILLTGGMDVVFLPSA